ncbi:hypothetical protein D3C76_1481090 [compost metagenome]
MLGLQVIGRSGAGQGKGEGFTEPLLGNVLHTNGLCREVNQFQTGIECRLNVKPKVNHRVELEHPPAINCLKVVVIQEIEDDVLAQTWANQPWQTNNQVVRKMLFDECLQQSPM